jgi:hypothetical protein
MRTIATVLLLALSIAVSAQKDCGTQSYTDLKKRDNKELANRVMEVESFIKRQALKITSGASGKNSSQAAVNIIRIPVVIHVLYNTAAQDVSDAQIKSQIDALNRDFRKINKDTINIPERFKAFAADVSIEFVLATADPKGRATTGVVRKKTSVAEWLMDDKIKFSAQGGDDAWDSKSYLNIWVGNLRKALGYSSIVGDAAAIDGVVINRSAFGTIGVKAPYNAGRTAVHEVGHWLGLKHIWGDESCGDDGVGDTPQQGNFTAGCPSGFRTSCGNSTIGDMYMNYMDFTNDACMNLFTYGQKERMRALFNSGGPRNSLLASKGLNAPWVEEAPIAVEPVTVDVPVLLQTNLKFYPNPAQNEVMLQFEDATWVGKELRLMNMNGSVLQKIKVHAKAQRINIATLKPGLYFIQGESGRAMQKLVKL